MKARNIMFGIGKKLLDERKHEVLPSEKHGSARGHDLLSILHRANTAEDVPDHQRLIDEEVIARGS
jgi:hypothetical protein